MSCNSAIYTVNSSQNTFPANSLIPFGSVIRRFGRNCQLDGNSIAILGSGYYDVEVSITLVPSAVGDISVQLYQNNVAVQGAVATGTATAVGDFVPLSITALLRNCGCDCNSNVALMVSAEAEVANLATVVKKV